MSLLRPILLATTNAGKIREMLAILGDVPAEWRTLRDFPPIPPPVEHGDAFDDNARLKALYYARALDIWALADDSGLEVDALGGAPGVHSARFAGEPGNDALNNRKLVAALAKVPPERRTARFRCAVALADPGDILAAAEGSLEGQIVDGPAGAGGFGYDPHFLIPELGQTSAELDAEHKNAVSHRGRALRALKPHLLRLIGQGAGDR